jgi:hypothetical protein
VDKGSFLGKSRLEAQNLFANFAFFAAKIVKLAKAVFDIMSEP